MAGNTFKQKIKVSLDGANKAAKGADKVSAGMKSLAKSALAAGSAYFAAQGLINGIKGAVSAYATQEKAEKALETALGKTSTSLLAQASALQKVTMFGDEATIQQMAFLGSIGMTEKQIKEIIPVAMDLSAATGISLESAVRNTAKTFSGLAGELGELVPQLRDLTAEEMKAGKAVEVMAELFGGQATSATDTLEGSMAQFNNTIGDLTERLGEAFAPVIKKVTQLLGDFFEMLFPSDPLKRTNQMKAEFAEGEKLFEMLENRNLAESTQKILKSELIGMYPTLLGHLDAEKTSVDELSKAYENVRGELLANIEVQMAEELVLDAKTRYVKATQNVSGFMRDMMDSFKKAIDNGWDYVGDNKIVENYSKNFSQFQKDFKSGVLNEIEAAKIVLEYTGGSGLSNISAMQRSFSMSNSELKTLNARAEEVVTNYSRMGPAMDDWEQALDNLARASEDFDAIVQARIDGLGDENDGTEKLIKNYEKQEIALLNIKKARMEGTGYLDNLVVENDVVEEQADKYQKLADAHELLGDTFDNQEDFRQKAKAFGDVMALSYEVQIDKLNEFTKANVNSAMAVGAANLNAGQAAVSAAGIFIAAKAQEAVAAFIADAFKKFGIVGGIIGAAASGAVGSLISGAVQSVGSMKFAAEGMNEVVTEPTLIMAGESGPEYVNIEPTVNQNTSGGGANIVFQGNILSQDFIEDEALPLIKNALRKGGDIGFD